MRINFNIQRILMLLLHRLHFIIVSGILMALLFFLYTSLMIKPVYSTSAMIFIQNYGRTNASSNAQSGTAGDARNSEALQSNNRVAEKIFSSDISGSANLAKICVKLFENSDDLATVYNGCGVAYSVEEGTFYITISVVGSDPQRCANVANQVAEKARVVFAKNFAYGQIGTIRTAKENPSPVSPNKTQNTIIGAFLGLLIACVIIILLDLIDTTIKNDDDIAEIYKVPVFAEIPNFES